MAKVRFWVPHLYLQDKEAMLFLGACKTVSGPSRGKNCIFPFKASGITYYSCKQGLGKYKNQHWCATKVKFDSSVSTWGWCGDSCPTKAPATIPNAKGKTFVIKCPNMIYTVRTVSYTACAQ